MDTQQLQSIRAKMQASFDFFQQEVNSIRTGRAQTSLVENILVATYGGAEKLRIREMGNITTPDAKTVMIEFWDSAVIPDAERTINEELKLTCQVNDNLIRIFLPPLTEERRLEFIKLLKQKTENAKIAIRQTRGDVMHDFKKSFEAKEISEDERFTGEKEVQKLTDEFIEKIESLEEKKDKEIMTI